MKRNAAIEVQYCLIAPIISWVGTESTLTEEMISKAKTLRIVEMEKNGGFKGECTDYEALLYLSSASLIQPFSHEWTKLFTHLFMKYYPDRKEIQEGIEKPTEWELQDLTRLKQWIYKKQIDEVKRREKAQENVEVKGGDENG